MTKAATSGVSASAEEIRAWLTEQIAGIIGLPGDEIDPDETFDSFGLASRDAVSLSGDLEDYLSLRLSPTLLYQYPTIRELADHLAETVTKARATSDGGQKGAVVQETKAVTPAGDPGPKPESAGRPTAPSSEQDTGEMSDAEVEAALLQKLLELDE